MGELCQRISSDEAEHFLTKTGGTTADTMMTIMLYHIKEGETRSFNYKKDEAAFLLIEGGVSFEWNGQSVAAERRNCFLDPATCLQTCRDTDVNIIGLADSEILVQATQNPKPFFSVLHSSKTIRTVVVDSAAAGGKGQYIQNTIFDYDTAPHSNLVLVEMLVPQGGFAGATPHLHPQPEVSYYRFDKPQGFGYYSAGEKAGILKDRSYTVTKGDVVHFRSSTPSYPMYVASMIRHFAGAPWRECNIPDEHKWIVG